MFPKSQQGIALVAVLWALALLSIVAAALTFETLSSSRIARNMVDKAAARAAADAGVQRAIADLTATSPKPRPTFRTDGKIYSWPFGNSAVSISIRDERGKINVNEAPETLLAALFASAGLEPGKSQALADSVADFRDPDDLVRPNGAEKGEYRAAGLAWDPKNRPFQTVEELQQVLGMTPEIYARVAPDLTVYSTGVINPLMANDALAAVLRQGRFASSNPGAASEAAYSIRAEAKGPNDARFVREVVIEVTGDQYSLILAWR